jgi:hypothetical protein
VRVLMWQVRKSAGKCWLKFLQMGHPKDVYKKALHSDPPKLLPEAALFLGAAPHGLPCAEVPTILTCPSGRITHCIPPCYFCLLSLTKAEARSASLYAI